MSRIDEYRLQLHELKDWTSFLLKHSGLPGPRGNLELAGAVAREASLSQIEAFLSVPADKAPENSAQVFLVFCGVLSLGRLVASGSRSHLPRLRAYASDSRWRIREAVAMALQTLGDADIQLLLHEMRDWSKGNRYEKRAAAAALAEPRLLTKESTAVAALKILDSITRSMVGAPDRASEAFRTLRKGMGYCWSVVVAAHPDGGRPVLERWLESTDPDVRWILKENLKKTRLIRQDPRWVKSCLARLGTK